MKRNHKIFALLTASALSVSFLAGCSTTQPTDAQKGAEATPTPNAAVTQLDKIKESGQLKVALSPDFAPMEFIDTTKTGQDQYVGFDVTLAKYLADELGVELVIEPMEFAACQAAVQTKSVDLSISGYSVTDERAENFELSDGYYTNNESNQCIMVPAGQGGNYTKPEDFDGKTLGAQNGSLQYNLLTSQLTGAEPYIVGDLNTGVMDLSLGNIDGLCVAIGNGKAIMSSNKGKYEFAQWEFEIEDDFNVVLIPKGETELLDAVNTALAKALENGYYPEWYAAAEELAGLETSVEQSVE